MSDEEKKVIEILNNYINAIDTFGTIDPKCCNNLYKPAKTILNLIEKQQHEIDVKQLQLHLQREELKAELEKKNKIIDLMADMIVKDHEWFFSEFDNYTKEQFIDYFTHKVEGAKDEI